MENSCKQTLKVKVASKQSEKEPPPIKLETVEEVEPPVAETTKNVEAADTMSGEHRGGSDSLPAKAFMPPNLYYQKEDEPDTAINDNNGQPAHEEDSLT